MTMTTTRTTKPSSSPWLAAGVALREARIVEDVVEEVVVDVEEGGAAAEVSPPKLGKPLIHPTSQRCGQGHLERACLCL